MNELKLLFQSVRRYDLPSEIRMMIVDNSSNDDIEQFCKMYSGFEFEHTRIPSNGLANARNFALDQCDTPYILFLDDDCIIPRGFFRILVDELKMQPTDLFTGKVEGLLPYNRVECVDSSVLVQANSAKHIDPPGNYMGISMEIIKSVGIFREDLGKKREVYAYGEDTEFIRRAQKMDLKTTWISTPPLIHLSLGFNSSEWFNVSAGRMVSRIKMSSKYRIKWLLYATKELVRGLFAYFKWTISGKCRYKYEVIRICGTIYGFLQAGNSSSN